MSTIKKPVKVKSTFEMKYKKGVYFNDLTQVREYINQKEVVVYLLAEGQNSDGTQYVSIRIDNIKIKKGKV